MPVFDIGLEHISLSFATKIIFDDVTQGIFEGNRIGIVGRNGEGKSTLIKLLSDRQLPDSGVITRRHGLTIGTLGQRDELVDEHSVQQAVIGEQLEHEWAANPNKRSIVETLLEDIPLNAQVSHLSGGQRRRADLARLLMQDWDVLFLDEPTNHLDIQTIEWLAAHLNSRWSVKEGALAIVTHDRWFLDQVCQQMWEIHDHTITPFVGGYSAYVLQRVERDRQAQVEETKRRNLARKELAWLSRGARARATKQKFHVKEALALIKDVPPIRNTTELKAMAAARLGKQVVDFIDVSKSYQDVEGKTHEIIQNLNWQIGPGDRIGIVGVNGAGKSTLLGLLDGQIQPTSGIVKIGKTVKFAVLSQRLDEVEELGDSRVKEVLSRYKTTYVIGGKEYSPSSLLERLDFEPAQLMTPVSQLSGGQKRRLQLMLILLKEPNVLILDEPGNDLDTDMLAIMEDLLDTWEGTLIVVSHDRFLLERVTDQQFALINGELRHLPRGIDEYMELVTTNVSIFDSDKDPGNNTITLRNTASRNTIFNQEKINADSSSNLISSKEFASYSGTVSSKEAVALDGMPPLVQKEIQRKKYEAQKKQSSLERRIKKLEEQKKVLDQQMAQLAQDNNFEELASHSQEQQRLEEELLQLEEEWMSLGEFIES